ncbi:MAG: hypothetical protein KAJ19_26710 [Gammaproteobacteria bacterium]|nr:hypothetical protein [Gammaproteobacteria bacterium]
MTNKKVAPLLGRIWVWNKFLARIKALTTGRYCIILTIGQTWVDWTIIELGKVERANS